jgi:hypothetical protein
VENIRSAQVEGPQIDSLVGCVVLPVEGDPHVILLQTLPAADVPLNRSGVELGPTPLPDRGDTRTPLRSWSLVASRLTTRSFLASSPKPSKTVSRGKPADSTRIPISDVMPRRRMLMVQD